MNIKRIIQEEMDDFDWIRDIVPGIDVTEENVSAGAKVQLKEDSKYYHQCAGCVGTVVDEHEWETLDCDFNDSSDEKCLWVYVEWNNFNRNNYRVGPHNFDLIFHTT